MSLVTCAGADVLRMRLHLPRRGPWFAVAALDTANVPTGRVQIEADAGLSLTGTVMPARAGVFLDTAHVQIIGGAGGMSSASSPAAFQNALVRDVVDSLLGGVGESASDAIDIGLATKLLPYWTIVSGVASRELDQLLGAVGQALNWRVAGDGSIWFGAESWPSQSLPQGADVLTAHPDEGRYVIGCQTPALLPGVFLEDINANITAVDHFIEPDQIRSWAWVE